MCYVQQCCVYGRNRQTMRCGRVSLLCCVTECILVLVLSVLRTAVLCLWNEQTESAVWHSYIVVMCVRIFIGIGVECVTYSSVVFMEGTDRQCSVARLVLYCVTVCILVLVLGVLRTAVLCLWKEQTDSAVWRG